MQQDQKNILIVGAGPVGALAAIYLRQRGHRVRLFEKRQDPRLTDGRGGRSINLALANRGIAALTQAGVMARIWPLLLPMRGRMVHPLGDASQLQPYGQTDEEVIYSVSRHGLNVALIEALAQSAPGLHPVELVFQHRCNGLNLDAGNATFIDELSGASRHVVFDHVMGADGAGSVVRQAIQAARSAGEQDGLVEMSPLGHGYKELTIPPKANGHAALTMDALHIWPRGNHMMIALPNQDASFTVTLFLSLKGEVSFEALASAVDQQQFLEQYYADALPLMPNWQQDFLENPVGHLATLHCHPWFYGDRALLIGDAAHAIVPFHGQGMNCGFEDCLVLNNCLDQQVTSDWCSLFSEFSRLRMPSCEAIAKMAIENYEEMRASVIDPVFKLKKSVGMELQRRYPAQFTPRYSMVMFGCLPYEDAYEQGRRNDEILNAMVAGKHQLSEIDWTQAERLLNLENDQAVLS